jgi:2'-5' RNA ligase
MKPKIRTFIAVRLTPEIISGLDGIQEELRRNNAQFRWVRPGNIHLTLKFLGYITPEELEKAKIVTRETLQSFGSFEISFSGLGAFPGIEHPRVIWIGIEKGKEDVERISSELEAGLVISGFGGQVRPFHPHITLGRVKLPKRKLQLPRVAIDDLRLGNMMVSIISIMKSELRPQGPIYSTLEEVILKRGQE